MTSPSALISDARKAAACGNLLESTVANIESFLGGQSDPVALESVRELLDTANWAELNDRFFRTLAFGTGGLRGRSIGRTVTHAERGTPLPNGRPEFPCTGTNALNDFNMARATRGLVEYVLEWWGSRAGRPAVVIAHDTRHFSREFAMLCAQVASDLGCEVHLFESARSTPELSFAVRQLRAQAGIVLTASHNPPHDNGFKCYFEDGAQVVEPHASGIIARVTALTSDRYAPLPPTQRGTVHSIGSELDRAYMDRLATLVLDPDRARPASDLRIVFSPIHGTGGVIVPPMLERLGFSFTTVESQEIPDGRFPTVKSPNPENAEALSLALALAEVERADLVLATDPDCDRMGAAIRNSRGDMQLLTGNQIGSLLAYYRTRKLFEQGVLTDANRHRAVLIKTFVTTDLQKAIADHLGVRCVETLTGFKYIGEKLTKYEHALPPEARQDYVTRSEAETRSLRLAHSIFYICGGEESYGYSGADFVRDKDGNGAVVMFAEIAGWAKGRGMTLDQVLDEIYTSCGFHWEKNAALTFEGAEGSAKIRHLAASYAATPPKVADGTAVSSFRDFAREDIQDSEGDLVPKESMLMVDLADGRRFAVRPSGTEPKIKYYLFGRRIPTAGQALAAAELVRAKSEVPAALDALWAWLQEDAHIRLG